MNDPFVKRRPGNLTHADLRWIAQGPSWRAPRLADLNRAAPIDYDQLMRGNRIAGRAFLAHGAELARRGKLTDVHLVAVAPFLDELAACPHLAAVESLNLDGNRIGAEGVRSLCASPHLTRLTELNLARNSIGLDGLRELVKCEWLSLLRTLHLAENGLESPEVVTLLRNPAFVNLHVTGLVEPFPFGRTTAA